jgi:hypothetical protein
MVNKLTFFLFGYIVALYFSIAITEPDILPLISEFRRSYPYGYSFPIEGQGIVEEASSSERSLNPEVWLNSGGLLTIDNGIGTTIKGSLPANSPWRKLYAQNNPLDTANGYMPQNIFRLITKKDWLDSESSAYFKILSYNTTESPNRNDSNGLLLLSRYQNNGHNAYYGGIRTDGMAVIKRKENGTYTVIASEPIFKVSYKQGISLPQDKWLGVRLITKNIGKDKISFELYLDLKGDGRWQNVLSAIDTVGSSELYGKGKNGIRTDFMDVQITNYVIRKLPLISS